MDRIIFKGQLIESRPFSMFLLNNNKKLTRISGSFPLLQNASLKKIKTLKSYHLFLLNNTFIFDKMCIKYKKSIPKHTRLSVKITV